MFYSKEKMSSKESNKIKNGRKVQLEPIIQLTPTAQKKSSTKSEKRGIIGTSNELTVGVSTRVPFSEENRYDVKFSNRNYDYEKEVYNITSQNTYVRPSNVPPLDLTPIINKREAKIYTTSYSETDSSSVVKNKLKLKNKLYSQSAKSKSFSDMEDKSESSFDVSSSEKHLAKKKGVKNSGIIKEREIDGVSNCVSGDKEGWSREKIKVVLLIVVISLFSYLWNLLTGFVIGFIQNFVAEEVVGWDEPLKSGFLGIAVFLLYLFSLPTGRIFCVLIAATLNNFLHAICLNFIPILVSCIVLFQCMTKFKIRKFQRKILSLFGYREYGEEMKKVNALDSNRKNVKESFFWRTFLIVGVINWPIGLKVGLWAAMNPPKKGFYPILILILLIFSSVSCFSGLEISSDIEVISSFKDYYLQTRWGSLDLFCGTVSFIFTMLMLCTYSKKARVSFDIQDESEKKKIIPKNAVHPLDAHQNSVLNNLNLSDEGMKEEKEEEVKEEEKEEEKEEDSDSDLRVEIRSISSRKAEKSELDDRKSRASSKYFVEKDQVIEEEVIPDED